MPPGTIRPTDLAAPSRLCQGPWGIILRLGKAHGDARLEAACARALHFGTVSNYLGYGSLKDHFPTMDIKPSSGCVNKRCLAAQEAYQVRRRGIKGCHA